MIFFCISILIVYFIAGCTTTKIMDDEFLKDTKDIAYLEVSLSSDTRNFSENLYFRGEAKCNQSFTKMIGQKVIESKPLLVATRRIGDKELYVKEKVPANKPIALRFIKNKSTDQYLINFVVVLEAIKTYQVSNYKSLEFVEKDSKKSAYFLPNDYFHRLLKCEEK
jgi:hypothetical protein